MKYIWLGASIIGGLFLYLAFASLLGRFIRGGTGPIPKPPGLQKERQKELED